MFHNRKKEDVIPGLGKQMPGLFKMLLQANQEYRLRSCSKKSKAKCYPNYPLSSQSHVSPFSLHRKMTGRVALFLRCLFSWVKKPGVSEMSFKGWPADCESLPLTCGEWVGPHLPSPFPGWTECSWRHIPYPTAVSHFQE